MYLIEFVENGIDVNGNPYVTECEYTTYSTKERMIAAFNDYIVNCTKSNCTIHFRNSKQHCVDITSNTGSTQTLTCYEAKEV